MADASTDSKPGDLNLDAPPWVPAETPAPKAVMPAPVASPAPAAPAAPASTGPLVDSNILSYGDNGNGSWTMITKDHKPITIHGDPEDFGLHPPARVAVSSAQVQNGPNGLDDIKASIEDLKSRLGMGPVPAPPAPVPIIAKPAGPAVPAANPGKAPPQMKVFQGGQASAQPFDWTPGSFKALGHNQQGQTVWEDKNGTQVAIGPTSLTMATGGIAGADDAVAQDSSGNLLNASGNVIQVATPVPPPAPAAFQGAPTDAELAQPKPTLMQALTAGPVMNSLPSQDAILSIDEDQPADAPVAVDLPAGQQYTGPLAPEAPPTSVSASSAPAVVATQGVPPLLARDPNATTAPSVVPTSGGVVANPIQAPSASSAPASTTGGTKADAVPATTKAAMEAELATVEPNVAKANLAAKAESEAATENYAAAKAHLDDITNGKLGPDAQRVADELSTAKTWQQRAADAAEHWEPETLKSFMGTRSLGQRILGAISLFASGAGPNIIEESINKANEASWKKVQAQYADSKDAASNVDAATQIGHLQEFHQNQIGMQNETLAGKLMLQKAAEVEVSDPAMAARLKDQAAVTLGNVAQRAQNATNAAAENTAKYAGAAQGFAGAKATNLETKGKAALQPQEIQNQRDVDEYRSLTGGSMEPDRLNAADSMWNLRHPDRPSPRFNPLMSDPAKMGEFLKMQHEEQDRQIPGGGTAPPAKVKEVNDSLADAYQIQKHIRAIEGLANNFSVGLGSADRVARSAAETAYQAHVAELKRLKLTGRGGQAMLDFLGKVTGGDGAERAANILARTNVLKDSTQNELNSHYVGTSGATPPVLFPELGMSK